MTFQVDSLNNRVRVCLEHAPDQRARAENIIRIYQRADSAHEEWGILDLIVQRPSGRR